MSKVNLDALIPREDFEFKDDSAQDISNNTDKIKLSDMEMKENFFYPVLRKPDFQRETNEWAPSKTIGLIESFVNQDLIPAIIMWNTKGSFTFVIDGAHRLSALIAWVNDDYGDGVISRKFFESIPEEQKKMAEKTRKMVEKKVHSYQFYKKALEAPKGIAPNIIEKARDLTRHTLQLQWVRGNVKKAEDSFFKINQEASKINNTELKILKARNKPNGIAARAIKNRGMGHKYWSKFSDEKQTEIEKLAKDINDMFFVPPLKQPINSLELPIAGKSEGGHALPLILNFVNIANGLIDKNEPVPDDDSGNITLEYLNKCKKISLKINSKDPSSLGLHPAVYLYSKEGNYKIVSFYAIVALILEFENNTSLQKKFIDVRSDFEKVILEYDQHISEIVRKYREGIKSYIYVKDFYLEIIQKLSQKQSKEELMKELIAEDRKKKLKSSAEFSVNAKSAVVIKEAIDKALKCKICGGLIDSKSITIDHIQRKRDGGQGTEDNAQIAHPYCNTTYKH
jgi:5-methylcytosine-specific restriction endonuclease McrA